MFISMKTPWKFSAFSIKMFAKAGANSTGFSMGRGRTDKVVNYFMIWNSSCELFRAGCNQSLGSGDGCFITFDVAGPV